ncbi:glycosyl hydrolase family 76-domain-containing protein [Chytriomyces sp. MP71]|nr:glycosyl hydrolase family 76-domain-containing protein [Chytriomyces sp. MP71]
MLIQILLPAASFVSAQTIDPSSQSSVLAAAKGAMSPLQIYFLGSANGVDNRGPNRGAWLEEFSDSSNNGYKRYVVQWHESGIFWDLFYQYQGYSKDTQYTAFVDGNIQKELSIYHDQVAFLDQWSATAGRWNDDIGWWALAMMTAAEVMPGGVVAPQNQGNGNFNPKYLDVASTTHSQMFDNWDPSTCDGGIFWSRDRNAPKESDRFYKSAITNAQHVELGARLYAITKDNKYITQADQVYKWMQAHLMSSDYSISDGVDSRTCTPSDLRLSYHSAVLIRAAVQWYSGTRTQSWLDEAHKHFAHISTFFVNSQGVLYDPQCANNPSCKDPTGYLWPMYTALAELYNVSNDETVKSNIVNILHTSTTAVISSSNCNADWLCMRKYDQNTNFTIYDNTNIRDQFEVVSLLNALAVLNGANVVQQTQNTSPLPQETTHINTANAGPGSPGTSGGSTVLYAVIGGVIAGILLIGGGIVACCMRSRRKNAATAQRRVSLNIFSDAHVRHQPGRNAFQPNVGPQDAHHLQLSQGPQGYNDYPHRERRNPAGNESNFNTQQRV